MTPEREAHLQRIKNVLVSNLDTKYRRDSADHEENLWEKDDLPEEAMMELIDGAVCIVSEIERRRAR
jgi:hypothetical protein